MSRYRPERDRRMHSSRAPRYTRQVYRMPVGRSYHEIMQIMVGRNLRNSRRVTNKPSASCHLRGRSDIGRAREISSMRVRGLRFEVPRRDDGLFLVKV